VYQQLNVTLSPGKNPRLRCGLLSKFFDRLLYFGFHHVFGTVENRHFKFRTQIGRGEYWRMHYRLSEMDVFKVTRPKE